jgi:hypothetical protein
MTEKNIDFTEYKYCECGCGQPTNIYKKKRSRFISGHNSKGITHPNWKGGRIMVGGYWYVWKPDHPFSTKDGYVAEHRLVMENNINRYLRPEEQVHHINKITIDNRIENLMLFPNGVEHRKYELTIDMSNRFCLLCGSNKTYINKKGRPVWYKYENDLICRKCYQRKKKKRGF